jgi:omega-6 fatty acid desaturase (delta-12 desaturase)
MTTTTLEPALDRSLPGTPPPRDAATRPVPHDDRRWQKLLGRYREPSFARSLFELTVTALPFAALWCLMWLSLGHAYWLCLLLAVPAAGFLVRLFMIQHDCGHGSFFRRRRANDWLGRMIGVLTLTSYDHWRQQHAVHHATSGNLDRRGVGDVDTLTVAEFRRLPTWRRRLAYRLTRSPLAVLGVGPICIFVLKHRLPASPATAGRDAWSSVLATNLAIAGVVVAMAALVGWRDFLLVQAPITWLASSIGVWLFYVQHQHEHAYWERDAGWSFQAGAMEGSSHLDLPPVLRWFTANIGVHHVHHLSSRIPSYRLSAVLRDHPELRETNRLTLRHSLQCFRLALWDEDAKRLVSFREAHRPARGRREQHACAPVGGTAGGSFAARTASTAGP